MREWAIGFAKDEWRSLYDSMTRMKFTDAELLNAGLTKQKDSASRSSERYYDAFRGRVMFPIFDASGRVVGFSGRTLSKDPTTPKYINSPETALFNKSELLYGLHRAKGAIRKKDYSILVEGQMDLIMAHQGGYSNAVAASGTALTRGHLERLRKLSQKILMAYDSDHAGLAAAEKNARIALQLGFEVKVAKLPEGSDPADLLLSDPAKWADALRNSRHIVDFELGELAKGLDKHKIAVALRTKVLPFIGDLQSSIEKAHYVREAANRTGIREEAIWEELKGVPSAAIAPPREEERPRPAAGRSNMLSVERRVMGMIYWKPELAEFSAKVVELAGEERFLALKEATSEMREELIFETEGYYGGADILERDTAELLKTFERKIVQEEVDRAQADLREASDEEEVRTLMTRIKESTRRLGELKSELAK